MNNLFKSSRVWLWISAIVALSALVQSSILLNSDVSWLLLVTKRWLAGGHYAQAFFDGDPPLIFWLYTPTLLLQKLFHFSIFSSLWACIALWAIVSLLLCKQFLEAWAWPILIFIFLIIPTVSYGQRDHLILIFTFPYLLATAYRLHHGQLSLTNAALIGLCASIGFNLKPSFFIVAFLIESLLWLQGRRLWRPELIVIILSSLAYLFFVYFHYPELSQIIWPAMYQLFYQGKFGWQPSLLQSFLFLISAVSCLFAGIIYVFLIPKPRPQQELIKVLFLAQFGFLLGYYLQGLPIYYYRMIPAFGEAIFTTSMIIYYFTQKLKNVEDYFIAASLATLCFITPVIIVCDVIVQGIQAKRQLLHSALAIYLKKLPANTTCYFITPDTLAFPLTNYIPCQSVSRFYFMWWMNAQTISRHTNFYQMLTEDINFYQPQYLIIDPKLFSYPPTWQSYRLKAKIDNLEILSRIT